MLHPETLCATIVSELTTDDFSFHYGKKPDQNFDADEMTYPAVFLDQPIASELPNKKGSADVHRIPLTLFFAYKSDTDDTKETKLSDYKTNAWAAAKEFILRLRAYNGGTPDGNDWVIDVENRKLTDVDNVFDINLCGCLLQFTLILTDSSSTCID
jgi:hypothetical protein